MNKKWGFKEIAKANNAIYSKYNLHSTIADAPDKRWCDEGLKGSEVYQLKEYSWSVTVQHVGANGGTAICTGKGTVKYMPLLYAVVNIPHKDGKKYVRYFYRLSSAYRLYNMITGER